MTEQLQTQLQTESNWQRFIRKHAAAFAVFMRSNRCCRRRRLRLCLVHWKRPINRVSAINAEPVVNEQRAPVSPARNLLGARPNRHPSRHRCSCSLAMVETNTRSRKEEYNLSGKGSKGSRAGGAISPLLSSHSPLKSTSTETGTQPSQLLARLRHRLDDYDTDLDSCYLCDSCNNRARLVDTTNEQKTLNPSFP